MSVIVLESLDHEQGIVHAAGEVAGENGIAYVPAPYRQTLALSFLKIASAHDRPSGSAGKDLTARLHLVVKVNEGNDPRKPAGNLLLSLQGRRVHVLAIPRDVPAAGKDEARALRRIVEYRLGCSRRVMLVAPGHQHGENAITPCDRLLDHRAVICRTRHDADAVL